MSRPKPRRKRNDSDEEMEDAAQPSTAIARSRAALSRNNADEPDDIAIDENLPPFDPRTFQHSAIPAAQHGKLKAVTESWDVPSKALDELAQLIKETAVVFTEIKVAIEDKKNTGVEFDPSVLEHLDIKMKETVDTQAEMSARKEAALYLRDQLTQGVQLTDPTAMWNGRVEESAEAYNKKTSRQKYATSQAYREYKEEVWGIENDGAMPPLTSFIPKEDGDASDDEDVEVGGMTVSFRDPLTRAWLDHPMTSKKCRHSYSRDSIFEYLGSRSDTQRKCPAAGCGEMVSRKDLEEDANLARLVRNAKRREEEEKQGVLNRRHTKKGRDNIIVDSDDDPVD
ncbi:hypothetical protein CPB86DRAFT_756692 [Serendipita vermifera]|nr:hypothetical protein CPB86DRAFT_756692 [Serendipita vermifera]